MYIFCLMLLHLYWNIAQELNAILFGHRKKESRMDGNMTWDGPNPSHPIATQMNMLEYLH